MNEQSEQKAVLIGLTGGIGSGKSTVAELFAKSGFTVLSADEVAQSLMATHTDVRAAIEHEFGSQAYRPDGSLSRDYLAQRVFGSTADHRKALQKLNTIVHPYVLDELLAQAEARAEDGERCIIIEIPLLYEIGLEDAFDYVVLVIAADSKRIERVRKRSSISEEQIRARMNEQVSPEQIKGYADFVIDNSHDLDKLRVAVDFLVQILPYLPAVDADSDGEAPGEEVNN